MKQQVNGNKMETIANIRKAYKNFKSDVLEYPEYQEYLNNITDRELVRKTIANISDAEDRLRNYLLSSYYRNKIRKYCNQHIGTDVRPFEVVKIVSPKCVEIRRMRWTAIQVPQDFSIGGFSAHCLDNDNQSYLYEPIPDANVIRIHLGKRGWGNGQYTMSNKPVYFYDYNF